MQAILFENAHVLDPDKGIELRPLLIVGGRISEASVGVPQARIDCRDALIAPGLVDIHGDSFERYLMPRPGAHFDAAIGFLDNDKALAANGITTAYLGVTLSWEPGLRSTQMGLGFIDSIARLRAQLSVDTKVHARLEVHNADAFDAVAELARSGVIDLVMLNEHLSQHERRLARNPDQEMHWAALAGMSVDEFAAHVKQVRQRAGKTAGRLAKLLAVLRDRGIPCGSHDDETPEAREHFHRLGARIAEFPCNPETARRAKEFGDPVVMGGPNVVRGGSANGNVSAATLIEEGWCTILASDYYYPSLLHAPFALARQRKMTLFDAWALVSTNPARALGLADRSAFGRDGHRADLVVIADWHSAAPRVVATFSRGMPAYLGRDFCATPMMPMLSRRPDHAVHTHVR